MWSWFNWLSTGSSGGTFRNVHWTLGFCKRSVISWSCRLTDWLIFLGGLLHMSSVPLCSSVGWNTANVHCRYMSLKGPNYGSFIKSCTKCNFRLPLGKIANEMCCQEFAKHKGMCSLVTCYSPGMFELCSTPLSIASCSRCALRELLYFAVSYNGRFYSQITTQIFGGLWWYSGNHDMLVPCV